MPTRMSGKLLNLGVQDWLWRDMVPLCGHCRVLVPIASEVRNVQNIFSHLGGAVCAGRHALVLP